MLTTSQPDTSSSAPHDSERRSSSPRSSAPRSAPARRPAGAPSRARQIAHGPSLSPDDHRLRELLSITAARRALDAREAELLADPDTAVAALDESGHHLSQWFAATTQQSPTAAGQRVRVAASLRRDFNCFATALAAGDVGWNHIEAFHRAANPRIRPQLAELQAEFVELAQHATFTRWCRELRGVAELLDQDGAHDPASDPSNNWLKLTPTYGGSIDVSGRLVGELAAQITAIIDDAATSVLDRHRADREQVEGPTATRESGVGALPSRAQASAEALGDLLERAIAQPDGAGTAPSPHLTITLDTAPASGLGTPPGVAGRIAPHLTTDAGDRVSRTALRWLLAASTIDIIEVSETGNPLRMGRRSRYATPQQRRALTVRDGGCVFPGCDRPPGWCDAHHVDEWVDGGPTDLDNMALLCRHHHRVTHQPGWKMSRLAAVEATSEASDAASVEFMWETPRGQTVRSQRHQQDTTSYRRRRSR